jgi:hypothetical protein
MATPEHLKILRQGVDAWNRWRKEDPDVMPDLRDADLRRGHLEGADLRRSQLSGANLGGANLRLADLRGAYLLEVDLSGTVLRESNLQEANLSWVNLSWSDLSEADFTGAHMGYTTFGSNDLSTVKGLDPVHHTGPSCVGVDTIYESKGNIPEVFLRRAGVPEDFIVYMRSLAPIEFYSCFISYSTKDQEFADRLYGDLQNNGVRCWFAPHDVKAGQKLHEQIDVAIRLYEKLLLILSPDSMNSEWVKTEIFKARKREMQEKRRMLFPLRLCSFEALRDWECFDADTGKDSAQEIREYFIPDFSEWKNHDAFKNAFERLLRDLKSSG